MSDWTVVERAAVPAQIGRRADLSVCGSHIDLTQSKSGIPNDAMLASPHHGGDQTVRLSVQASWQTAANAERIAVILLTHAHQIAAEVSALYPNFAAR